MKNQKIFSKKLQDKPIVPILNKSQVPSNSTSAIKSQRLIIEKVQIPEQQKSKSQKRYI